MNLLMLSSSRAGDSGYLETARELIFQHLNGVQDVLFIPYAGVTIDWNDYTDTVNKALPELNVTGIHQYADPAEAVNQANAILVGGGNTFRLLSELYTHNLIDLISARVETGTPYIGWSAGSNICGNSIRTTNDMPIIQPRSFDALNLVPFQLNPHYSDYQPPGFNGETRAQRISEFCALNPDMPVIGIREGSALLRRGDKLTLVGELDGVVFEGTEQRAIQAGADLSTYLTS